MLDTGIIRRIDELGRVVIPKELRKKLRIKEGDPLEIYSNLNELVLRKYSPMDGLKSMAKSVADGLNEETGKTCIITDNNVVVCVSKNRMKELVGKEISAELFASLCERRSLIANKIDNGDILPITREDEHEFENQVAVPIVASGDCYGGLLLVDTDKGSRFTMNELRFAKLGASFLAKQLED